jgi:hypothetical protein
MHLWCFQQAVPFQQAEPQVIFQDIWGEVSKNNIHFQGNYCGRENEHFAIIFQFLKWVILISSFLPLNFLFENTTFFSKINVKINKINVTCFH